MTIKSLALLGLLALLAWARPANAEAYHTCTGFITSLPAVISTQGTWCLKQDLSTNIASGNAIAISTNNVTIDCNNFKLGGLAAGLGTQARGIYGFSNLNTTVRNCNIRGFYFGIYFSNTGGGGHAVEDNRFDGNTSYAIYVAGDGSVVQRNRVFETGGTTVDADVFAIAAVGTVDILDNTVSGVVPRATSDGSAYGIYTFQNPSGRILGNGVRGLLPDGTGAALGIYNGLSGRVTLSDNTVIADVAPGTIALTCSNSNGRARNNVIGGFSVALSTCGNAGGNDITP